MARLRYNGLATTLGASLTSSATSITFSAALTHSGGTAVPTITGTDSIPLTILDAGGAVSEIVHLTAYTSGATTGTITRGQESTTGVSHSSGDKVVHGPTVADVGTTMFRSVLSSNFTTTSTSTTDITGLSFSHTPTVAGVLTLSGRLLAQHTAVTDLYITAEISPAPVTGTTKKLQLLMAMTASRNYAFPITGSWTLAAGTAYTVQMKVLKSAAGTLTVDSNTEYTELTADFAPSA